MTEHLETSPTRIMLIDDEADRRTMMATRLLELGFEIVASLGTASGLLFQIEQQQPDVLLVGLQSPGRAVLESLKIVHHHSPKPVLLFSREDDSRFISAAVEAGVTPYSMQDFCPDKVKPFIDVALAQFKFYQSLRQQLDDTRATLETRSAVEKAKVLLMQQHAIDEDQAHKTLRTLSMDTNQSLAQAAGSVIRLLERKAI